MTFLEIYGLGLAAIMALMIVLWLVSLALKNSSIVDSFWGPGFVLAAWLYYLLTPDGFLPRKLLICALVTIWGLRLAIHIARRNWGKPEDFRYQKWRNERRQQLVVAQLLQGLPAAGHFAVDHLHPPAGSPVLIAARPPDLL